MWIYVYNIYKYISSVPKGGFIERGRPKTSKLSLGAKTVSKKSKGCNNNSKRKLLYDCWKPLGRLWEPLGTSLGF